MTTRGIVFLIIVALAISAGIFFGASHLLMKPPVIESWYQHDIIGQGELTEVARDGDTCLISLRVMHGPQDPENPTYRTYVFEVRSNRLMVQNRPESPEIFVEGDYIDTKRFEVGTWYVLFRKASPLRYLLYRMPGPPPNYPITAPMYES